MSQACGQVSTTIIRVGDLGERVHERRATQRGRENGAVRMSEGRRSRSLDPCLNVLGGDMLHDRIGVLEDGLRRHG